MCGFPQHFVARIAEGVRIKLFRRRFVVDDCVHCCSSVCGNGCRESGAMIMEHMCCSLIFWTAFYTWVSFFRSSDLFLEFNSDVRKVPRSVFVL